MDLDQKEVQSLSLSIRSAIAAALDGPGSGKLVSSMTYSTFNCVVHSIILAKLEFYNFSKSDLSWMNSYLIYQKNVTVFNDNTYQVHI